MLSNDGVVTFTFIYSNISFNERTSDMFGIPTIFTISVANTQAGIKATVAFLAPDTLMLPSSIFPPSIFITSSIYITSFSITQKMC